METTNDPAIARDPKTTLLEYVENNPVAAVVQALVLGFAVGMVIRLIEGSREKEPEIDVNRRPTIEEAKFHVGSLLLPFLWPAWKKAREVSDQGAKSVRETVKQVKRADLAKKGQKHLKQAEAWAEREAGRMAKLGRKKKAEAEAWAEREAERIAKLGKKTKEEAGTWAEREKERLAELGKKTAKDVEEWVQEEKEHLAELGKKKAQEVEDWVEKEVLPTAEYGWKRLMKLFR